MVDFLRKRYDNCNDSNQKIEDLTYAGSIADLEPPGADGRLAPVVCRHERPTIEALRWRVAYSPREQRRPRAMWRS